MKKKAANRPIVKIIRLIPGKEPVASPPIRLTRGHNHRIVFESPEGDSFVYFKERITPFKGPAVFCVPRGRSIAIGPLLSKTPLKKASFGVVLLDEKGRLAAVDPGFIIEEPPGGGDDCEVFEVVVPRKRGGK